MTQFIQPGLAFLLHLVIVTVVALGAFAGRAHAQATLPTVQIRETPVEPNGPVPIDKPVETGSRLGLTPRETPGSVYLLDRETIEARGARDTQEILRGAPGMNASAPPGGAGFASYRGFTSSQITHLWNGISVQYDAIAARPIDSWIYDRVEIIGGPSSFLFGAGAVGGSVNYVTKLAQRTDSAWDFFGSYGSYDTYTGAFGVNRRLGSGDGVRNYLRLDASHTGSEGWSDKSDSRLTNAAFSILTDLSPRLSHTLALEYQSEDRRPYWGTPLTNPTTGVGRIDPGTRFRNYNSADGSYEQVVRWTRSITEFRFDDRTTLKNTLYHYDAERDYRNVEVYRFNATNTLVDRSATLAQKHGQSLLGNRIEATRRSSLWSMPSDWAAGVDVSFNRQTRYPSSLPASLGTVNPYSFTTENFFQIPGVTPAVNPDRTNRVKTWAVFLENRTRITPQLALVTGLRHDWIDIDIRNWRTATATDPAYYETRYTPTTGRAGLVYDITPRWNVYVQYATAADPPAGILSTATFSAVRDFDLTRGRQYEIGSKFDFWERRGTATVAAYDISRKNLAITDPTNPLNTIPVGEQTSRGLELSAGVRITPALRAQANFAVVDARFENFTESVGGVAVSRAGNRPTNVPARIANAWINYAFLPTWDAGISARAVSSVWGNTANTLTAPGYVLWDASVSKRISRNVTVIARGRNLGDRVYAANVTGTPMYILGEPRTFDVAVRASF